MNVLARIVTFAAAGTFLVIGIPAHAKKPPESLQTYEVLLVPQIDDKLLPVLKTGKSCRNNFHEGCMYFGPETSGVIHFYLPGAQAQFNNCAGNPQGQGITSIKLTNKPDPSDAGCNAKKGVFDNSVNLSADKWILDAFPGVANNGVLYEESDINSAKDQYWLINLNNADGEHCLWYEVIVTDCSNPAKTYKSDPRVDNEG